MLSFDGVELENKVIGWKVVKGTSFFAPLTWSGDSVKVPGRDESIPAPATLDTPAFPIVMYTRKPALEALLSLWGVHQGFLVDDVTGRRALVTVESVTPSGGGPADLHVQVNIVLSIAGVFFRDIAESTSVAVALGAASVLVPVMSGLSAPVRDAVVRVKGQANGLQVTDADGSYFRYMVDLLAGNYLRFESATGRAFLTTTDTWVGGTEMTGSIDNGPGPYALQLTPKRAADPTSRNVQLTVTTSSRSGATIEVRGRRAYVTL